MRKNLVKMLMDKGKMNHGYSIIIIISDGKIDKRRRKGVHDNDFIFLNSTQGERSKKILKEVQKESDPALVQKEVYPEVLQTE